jgi:hypothetical protein
VQFWRDRTGEVHLRGEATLSSGFISGSAPLLLALPPGYRPVAVQSASVTVGQTAGQFASGSALLIIDPSGLLEVIDPSFATAKSVFLGEIMFRTDA